MLVKMVRHALFCTAFVTEGWRTDDYDMAESCAVTFYVVEFRCTHRVSVYCGVGYEGATGEHRLVRLNIRAYIQAYGATSSHCLTSRCSDLSIGTRRNC